MKVLAEDEILPAVTVKIDNLEALRALTQHPNVDYVTPVDLHASEFASMDQSGCSVPTWTGGTLSQLSSFGDSYSGAFAEIRAERAWEYLNNAPTAPPIGYVDSGVDQTGQWPEITAMGINALSPNLGTCSHGNRMILVTAGPRNGIGSVGVAFGTQVISSDHGGGVVPTYSQPYDALHRLYLSGGMPAGSKIIAFGFGLSGVYSDLRDLIELGYYTRGFAFFSPAGSWQAWAPVVFPASMPEVFAVTARTSITQPHPTAHVGPQVDGVAFAPLFVSGPGGAASSLDASSAATAQVAGVAVLALRKYPSLTNAALYARLRTTAREFCGPAFNGAGGIINAEAAVGGLCVPQAQFTEVTYSFFPNGPTSYIHSYCFSYSGGVLPVATVNHINPHPYLPLCGSFTVVPNPTDPVSYMSVSASLRDDFTTNPPITNYFRVKVITQLGCPPEYPNCM